MFWLFQVASEFEVALVEARRGGVRTSRPMDGPAAEVVAVIDSGGAVGGGVVPEWFGHGWVGASRRGVVRTRDYDSEPLESGNGVDVGVSGDNVLGCVRELVTAKGDVGVCTGMKEVGGLPSSGERVVVCGRAGCCVPEEFPHVADPGGLFPSSVRDGVRRGVPYRTSACDRTCHGCGVTHTARNSRDGHLWMCGGCHAMVPFVRGGEGDENAGDRVLAGLRAQCPVYCGPRCQTRHWKRGHDIACRRDDLIMQTAVDRSLSLHYDGDGQAVARPEYGVPIEGPSGLPETLPFLVAPSRTQPGLRYGWGFV